MGNLSVSDKYSIAAVIALMIMVIVNNAVLMLALAVLGIIAGFWVFRQGEVRRAGFVAFAGFAIAAVFAVMTLVRAG